MWELSRQRAEQTCSEKQQFFVFFFKTPPPNWNKLVLLWATCAVNTRKTCVLYVFLHVAVREYISQNSIRYTIRKKRVLNLLFIYCVSVSSYLFFLQCRVRSVKKQHWILWMKEQIVQVYIWPQPMKTAEKEKLFLSICSIPILALYWFYVNPNTLR